MPEEKRVLTPSKTYKIELKIKNLDYTNDLRSIRIVSSINAVYQIVIISLSLDPNDVILEDVMGKEPLKLSIKLIGRVNENIPLEDIKMELQYVKHESSAVSKQQRSDGKMMDRVTVSIISVCRKPFKIMTYAVNDIFFEKTPKQIIEELVTKAGGELEYDSVGENIEFINQVILPHDTLYNTIRYLDNNFGLFHGSSNFGGFCQFDGKVYIRNLSRRLTALQEYTIYQFATDDSKNKDIINLCSDGKNFYTYKPLKSQYSGTAKFSSLAKKIYHIVKPKDSLFDIIEQDLYEICSEFGAIAKNSEITVDSNLNDRERYIINNSGNDSSDTYANSRIAREIIGLATLEIDIEKNLPVLKLIKVGEPVKVKCRTMEYVPLGGKYILKSSDLSFSRDTAEWETTCHIVLMRTNLYI